MDFPKRHFYASYHQCKQESHTHKHTHTHNLNITYNQRIVSLYVLLCICSCERGFSSKNVGLIKRYNLFRRRQGGKM